MKDNRIYMSEYWRKFAFFMNHMNPKPTDEWGKKFESMASAETIDIPYEEVKPKELQEPKTELRNYP